MSAGAGTAGTDKGKSRECRFKGKGILSAKNAKRWIGFIVVSLAVELLIYLFLTVSGYSLVNSAVLSLCMRPYTGSSDCGKLYGDFKNDLLFICPMSEGYAANYDFALDNTAYLAENAELRYVVLDLSYSAGELINLDLDGVRIGLGEVCAAYSGETFASVEFANFIEGLRSLNRKMSSNMQLRVLGVGPEDRPELTAAYVRYLCSNVTGGGLPPLFERLREGDYENKDGDKSLLHDLHNAFGNSEPLMKSALLDNFFTCRLAVNNYFAAKVEYDRTALMAESFNTVFRHNRRAVYCMYTSVPEYASVFISENPDMNRRYSRAAIYCAGCEAKEDLVFNHELDDFDEGMYVLINSIYRHFDKYGAFVSKLAHQEAETLGDDSRRVLVMVRSEHVTDYVLPEGVYRTN